MTDFTTLGLGAPMLAAVQEQGFTTPTEIQAATIPALMLGSDVIGVAQTGGGKTAAFVLPMIEKLLTFGTKPKSGMPRALILAPTRELAIQISETVKELTRNTPLKNCTVFGGAPYRTQTHILRRGVDILVATPGRLIDHMKQGNIYLDETCYFVLDEADRMLDMGFVDDVRRIHAQIRSEHQTVLFSATMNPKVRELAGTILNEPEHIEVAREATIADNLTHKVMFVPRNNKHELLLHMIEKEAVYKALIFVRTKKEADELADFMETTGLKVRSIHGDKPQRMRERIIRGFKDDRTNFLVATDVAARGIDVKDISHVFNIDVPVEAENYVHRIGRTARGGASGVAYTFCCKSEMGLLRTVESVIKMRIEEEADHPFPQPSYDKHKPARKNRRPGRRMEDASHKKSKRPSGKWDGKKTYGKKDSVKKGGFKKDGARSESSWRPEAAGVDGDGYEAKKRHAGARNDDTRKAETPRTSDDRKVGGDRKFGDRKPFRKGADGKRLGDKKPFRKDGDGKRFGDKKPFRKDSESAGDKKPFRKDSESAGDKKPFRKSGKPGGKPFGGDTPGGKKPSGKKPGSKKRAAKPGDKKFGTKTFEGAQKPAKKSHRKGPSRPKRTPRSEGGFAPLKRREA